MYEYESCIFESFQSDFYYAMYVLSTVVTNLIFLFNLRLGVKPRVSLKFKLLFKFKFN